MSIQNRHPVSHADRTLPKLFWSLLLPFLSNFSLAGELPDVVLDQLNIPLSDFRQRGLLELGAESDGPVNLLCTDDATLPNDAEISNLKPTDKALGVVECAWYTTNLNPKLAAIRFGGFETTDLNYRFVRAKGSDVPRLLMVTILANVTKSDELVSRIQKAMGQPTERASITQVPSHPGMRFSVLRWKSGVTMVQLRTPFSGQVDKLLLNVYHLELLDQYQSAKERTR